MSSFEDDSGLTQTFNQASMEYVTVLKNGVWMNFIKWQTKLIKCLLINNVHKSCVSFVTKGLLQIINRARHGPNPNMYKDERVRLEGVQFLDGEHARKIIEMFQEWMKPIPDILEKKKDLDHEGISNKKHIEKHYIKQVSLCRNQDTRSATRSACTCNVR